MKFAVLPLVLALPQAMAHYNFERFIFNGQLTGPYEYVRRVTNSNSPVTDQLSTDIRCNVGAFGNAKDTKIYNVVAGVDSVGFTIRDYIGHPGPLYAYLSKSTTADVRDYDGSGDWFKIYELGVDKFATYDTGMTWKSDGFKEYSFVLPKAIPNGQYLLRGEHIAIHGSGTLGGAQHYMSCAQINVSGGTGAVPGPPYTGKFPGIYQPTDPGLYFSPYWPPVTNYTMPGPPVYPGGSSGPSPSATTTRTSIPSPTTTTTTRTTTTPVVTSRTTTTTTTTSRTTTTSSRTTTTATTTRTDQGAGQPKWAQCGGQGWTGSTICVAGSTCSVINPYYSQCV